MEERRIVTVLFCDVTGSTALASQVDAEDWAEIISGAFPLLIDPVERYGGTIARLMGDAILAFFGAPVSHEDDPQRAILAALDILDAISTYRAEVHQDFGLEFNVRIGINTGEVITREVGSRDAREYTALGDAVNVAARMEQTARPGTIQITAETYRLALPYFEFEPLGPIEVKGKEGPVEAYRVLGRAVEPGRRRGVADLAIPMVGRERELDLLRYKLSDLEAGRGGVVALVGEAGLGKTRLLDELRRSWLALPEHHPDSWTEDQMVSFESSVPYGLVRRRLVQALGIDGGAPAAIRDRLGALLSSLAEDERESALRAVGQLFGGDHGPGERAGSTGMEDAGDFRHELALVTERICSSWVESIGRGIYVIDDFHWADPASADLLEVILPDLVRLPLLVVLAFRPERESPAWGLHERVMPQLGVSYLTIPLAPLDDRTSATLLETLLPGAEFLDRYQRMLLERIDGNPLFAEEIVRSLVEQGAIQAASSEDELRWRVSGEADLVVEVLPTTLHALIQERMDRLDGDARQLLQLAAVIGRVFEVHELDAACGDPGDLQSQLAALERAMLIHRLRRADRESYEFHHALTWEAAYRSILRRHRRSQHLRVAEALERLHEGSREAVAGRLSVHFAEAADERAIPYAIMAGDEAFALYAPAEAIEHYTRAIDVAERLGVVSMPFDVLRRRGKAYQSLGKFEPARQDFERALVLADETGDPRARWQARTDIANLWEGVDYQQSGEWRQRALMEAQSIGDRLLIADSLAWLGNWYTNFERSDEARAALTEALSIFKERGDKGNQAHVLDLLGIAEIFSGDSASGRSHLEEAATLFEELGDLPRLSLVLTAIGTLRGSLVGDTMVIVDDRSWDEAVAVGQRALDIARSINWKTGLPPALIQIANMMTYRGRYARALDAVREGLEAAADIEHPEWLTYGNVVLGAILLDILNLEESITHLERAYRYAHEIGSRWFVSLSAGFLVQACLASGRLDQASDLIGAHDDDRPARAVTRRRLRAARAELALAEGRPSDALDIVERLYETAVNLARPASIPRLALLQGRALTALGRHDEALAILDEALYYVQEQDLPPLLWRIHAARGRTLRLGGRASEAGREAEEARSIVDRLAGEVADIRLREQFISRAGTMIDGDSQPF